MCLKSVTPSLENRLKEVKLEVVKLVRRQAETALLVIDKGDLKLGSSGGDGER